MNIREQNEAPAAMMIDWGCIIRAVLKRWEVIVLAAIISAVGAYILAGELYSPRYSATTTYVVSERSESVNVYSSLDAASDLAEAFTDILNSNILKEKVSLQTGLSMDNVKIRASLISDTNLLDLKVTTDRPEDAFFILEALIEHHDIVTSKVMGNAVLQTLKAPTVPTVPDNVRNNKGIAVKAGIAAAVAAAVTLGIICYLSDTVKNAEQAAELIDAKLLSVIHHENSRVRIGKGGLSVKRRLLIHLPSCGFHFSETFKNLRARVEHRMAEDQGKILLIASAAKGEGRTTVASNLAVAFAQKNKRVVLIDCNTVAPAIASLFSVTREKDMMLKRFSYSIGTNTDYSVLRNEDTRLYIVTTVRMNGAAEFFLGASMKRMLEILSTKFDYIILDSPGFDEGIEGECLARLASHTLLVVRQDDQKAKRINDMIDTVSAAGSKVIGFVFNDVKASFVPGNDGKNDVYGYGYGGYAGYGGKYGSRYGKYSNYENYRYGKYEYGRYGYHKQQGQEIDPDTLD